MRYNLTIPARINLLGNPSDGNEGDFATISLAVDVRAGASLEPSDGLVLESSPRSSDDPPPVRLEFRPSDYPLPYDGRLDLLKGAFNRLHAYSAEFRSKVEKRGVRMATWSDVPRQSGLGGSSLFVLLALSGLREYYGLDPRIHNDYVLAELTQRVESRELGITCGFADRYVPLFGGIAYLDYQGKLHHREIGEEPYVSYERLDEWVDDLPLVLISSGVICDSGDVHGKMRPRYLEEHGGWVNARGDMPPMVRFMKGAWRTAWRGKIALLARDWPSLGELMNENHRLVDEMMTYCGFAEGAGRTNRLLIEAVLANGALGAKLTGAGGGGSVCALTHPGEEASVTKAWERVIAREGLGGARVYRPKISRTGLIVQGD